MDEYRQDCPPYHWGYRPYGYVVFSPYVSSVPREHPLLKGARMRFDNVHIWTFLIGAAVGYLVLPYVVSMVGGMFNKG